MTSTSHAGNTPAFHGFSKLPPELRIKIWKEACLPRTDNDHGLQYVTVDLVTMASLDADEVLLDENLEGYDEEFDVESDETEYITLRALERIKKRRSNAQTPPDQSNKQSAYLWDAGLWLACKESRDAITEYLNINKWIQHAKQEYTTDLPSWYDKKFPSTLVPHETDKPWRPIVMPRSDIFCIDTPHYLPRSLYGMKLLAPFLGQKRFTITQDWNIAFKFDSSWIVDFPRSIYEIQSENSPRGLLADWIERFEDEAYPEPTLWIIYDTARWVRLPGLECKTTYRDFCTEYVQIHWCALRGDAVNNETGDVRIFMELFADVVAGVNEDWFFSDWFCSVKEHVQFLVRKENEIPSDILTESEESEIPSDFIAESEDREWNPRKNKR
ncbi:hypothetical protein FPOAC2_11828 [Fusarium poae]|jgi:hypothetical protein|nr:hypothetical protein FPOAC1_011521 [Fusarium poae]KAG8666709.1 hypothetical protein FPOAC1_011521 [Fusarium poae]